MYGVGNVCVNAENFPRMRIHKEEATFDIRALPGCTVAGATNIGINSGEWNLKVSIYNLHKSRHLHSFLVLIKDVYINIIYCPID